MHDDVRHVRLDFGEFFAARISRSGKLDRYDFLDAGGVCTEDDDLVSQIDGLRDIVGDVHDGLLLLLPEVADEDLKLVSR